MIKRLKKVLRKRRERKLVDVLGRPKTLIFGSDPEFYRRLRGEPNPDWIPIERLLEEQRKHEK